VTHIKARGDSYTRSGVACRKFLKESLRGTKIPFYGRSWKFCSFLRSTIIKTTNCSLLIFIRLNTLKDYAKAQAVEILRLNTLTSTKPTLNPLEARTSNLFLYTGVLLLPSERSCKTTATNCEYKKHVENHVSLKYIGLLN